MAVASKVLLFDDKTHIVDSLWAEKPARSPHFNFTQSIFLCRLTYDPPSVLMAFSSSLAGSVPLLNKLLTVQISTSLKSFYQLLDQIFRKNFFKLHNYILDISRKEETGNT